MSRSLTARKALVRSLIRALVEHGAIKTTLPKAKLIQRIVEKLLSRARGKDLSARRHVLAFLANDRKTTDRLFQYAAASSRVSGFTRIIKLPSRRGDAGSMARIEIVDQIKKEEEKKSKGEKKEKKEEKKETKKKGKTAKQE